MHAEALAYVEREVKGRTFKRVLEFGSLDINGTVRDVIAADHYHGIDQVAGPGVDEVADARTYRAASYDLVVCCEVLEHVKDKGGVIDSAAKCLLGPGCCGRTPGMFIITCACNPREPHSAVDGGPVRDGEWYENVNPSLLKMGLHHLGFDVQRIVIDDKRGDLYVTALRR
jgi:hypothetical protein